MGGWFSTQRAGEAHGQIKVMPDKLSWRGCTSNYVEVLEPYGTRFPGAQEELKKAKDSPFETVLLRFVEACWNGVAYIRLTTTNKNDPQSVQVVPYDSDMKPSGWLVYRRILTVTTPPNNSLERGRER